MNNFNTSHVTVYPATPITAAPAGFDFNTSHVTVYPDELKSTADDIIHFNTSHVTVYRRRTYSYRKVIQISIHLMLLFIPVVSGKVTKSSEFQYISCYCLSWYGPKHHDRLRISIHLMLLFIFTREDISLVIGNFNTSHVTVYLFCQCQLIHLFKISIHLMLLFISEMTKSVLKQI